LSRRRATETDLLQHPGVRGGAVTLRRFFDLLDAEHGAQITHVTGGARPTRPGSRPHVTTGIPVAIPTSFVR
jgi:hypothetical protein